MPQMRTYTATCNGRCETVEADGCIDAALAYAERALLDRNDTTTVRVSDRDTGRGCAIQLDLADL
jgi:hypothetical protein